MKHLLSIILPSLLLQVAVGQSPHRTLTIDDILSLKQVRNLVVSPDEAWVAYTITSIDTAKDKSTTQLWMSPTDGGEAIQMTSKDYSASAPRWSPDGKYLSFLAAKGEKAKTQVWTLNLLGGEAQPLTKVKQGVSGYEWSPDGSRLVLLIKDPKPADLTKDTKDDKKPLPHVIDRLHFKQDYTGYLDRRRTHLYVFTPGDTAATQITSGDYDDSAPDWSPDGKTIAFVSDRSENPDLSYDTNIWTVDADNTDKGAHISKITDNPGSDRSPAWSPDGSQIAYITVPTTDKMPFRTEHLAVVSSSGGAPTVLTAHIDRDVRRPAYSKDGEKIVFLLVNEGENQLVSIQPDGSNFGKIVSGEVTAREFAVGQEHLYTLHSTGNRTSNVYKVADEPIPLTSINKDRLEDIDLGGYERIEYLSSDNTKVQAFVVKPPGFDPGQKYPLILWIHGGPIAQYSYDLDRTTPRLFAAHGYVVLLVNPRGSSGRGQDFCQAIFADWGNKDYDDVMAGVDHLLDEGYIDPARLGVGGWSYGGILTNYVITQNQQFSAAISGASLGLIRANFGHDQYLAWYNSEFGMPWDNQEVWERLSPFNRIQHITTPTLWIGGAVDWNVPIVNSEQMYLGMKSLGRETQLVVYPNEHHGIRRPSFQKDRLERYLAWFDKYLGQ